MVVAIEVSCAKGPVVEGEVDLGEGHVAKVWRALQAGKRCGRGLSAPPTLLLEDALDVVGAEGAVGEGVDEGLGHLLPPVALAQQQKAAEVVVEVDLAAYEPGEVLLGLGAQREKALDHRTPLAAVLLPDQRPHMEGVDDVLPAAAGTAVAGLRLNHLRENPCVGIPRFKEARREPPYLGVEDQQNLVDAMPPQLQNAVALTLDTGLRLGELLRLDWTDVDTRGRVLTVRTSKNKKPRHVPFTRRGLAALQTQREWRPSGERRVRDLVFEEIATVRGTGEVTLLAGARKAWERAREAAGFADLRWHDMRHVFAVTAARANVPLGDLQKILGHSSLVMVLRYAAHSPANSGDLARKRLEDYLEGNGKVSEALEGPAYGSSVA